MSHRSLLVSVALAALASGCAYGQVRQVIRAQFASELDCPEVRFKKRSTWYAGEDPNQFKVMGCGVVRTYTCDTEDGLASYDEPACTWVDGDADAPDYQPAEPLEPVQDAMDEPMMDDDSGFDDEGMDDEGMDDDFGAEAESGGGEAKAKASGRFRFGSD